MSKTQKITAEQIDAARKALQNLPLKECKKTKEEAVIILKKSLKQAAQKGYNAQDMSDILKKEGITVPTTLVKKCLLKHKRKTKNT